MAFDISALSAYTEQERLPLLTKAVVGAKTQKLVTPQSGVLSGVALNLLATDAIFQAGQACGWSPSGTTTFTQRTITANPIRIHERLCPKDLMPYWTQILLKGDGSNPENINDFRDSYTELKLSYIAKQVEKAMWKGDTTLSDTNLKQFDGYIKLVNAASGIISGGSITGALTVATGANNVFDAFYSVFNAIPEDILDKEDIICFCGYDVFRLMLNYITKNNFFHYTTGSADLNSMSLILPGTNLRIEGVAGLSGQNVSGGTPIVAARSSNLFFGFNIEGEEDKCDFFYAKEAMELRFITEFRAGVQFAFPDQIVQLKLS